MKLIILKCGDVPESLRDDLRRSDAVWLEAHPDRVKGQSKPAGNRGFFCLEISPSP